MNWYDDFREVVRLDEPMAKHVWMGIGGPADYLVRPRNEAELAGVLARLGGEGIPFRVLGAGANVLVDSEGIPGAVIHLAKEHWGRTEVDGNTVRAGAGANFPSVIQESVRAGLAGMETLVGIPAQVGGAVRMNAGGAFGDIGRLVERIKVMTARGETYWRQKEDLVFEYRKTNISAPFILQAEFTLAPDDPDRILERMRKVWMYKNNTQPLAAHCAGCIFKNPPGQAAGKLIDDAGLKGTTLGKAAVSTKHANYIVVEPGGTSKDVLDLIELVRERVGERSGVELELEVQVWRAAEGAVRS